MKRFLCALAALGAVFACHGTLNPPTGPNTSYPCGIGGVECGGRMCCPPDHVCGGPDRAGFIRCESGYCCYDGPKWPGSSSDAGADKVPVTKY